jgi:hypothetical protein
VRRALCIDGSQLTTRRRRGWWFNGDGLLDF